ncbi:MAG: hypothetical protein EKK64_07210 [Neisseriaceae bacterium]|nr:MAG: hypothetical protein EKK64_07210 [Neisseriaceae bacterium]
MNITEFKKLAKELAVKHGLTKRDISITTPRWLVIKINAETWEQYKALKDDLEKLAGYKDNSDIMTDYFDYDVNVINKYNTKFSGLLITR